MAGSQQAKKGWDFIYSRPFIWSQYGIDDLLYLVVACSQTPYFLFKVCWVIKYKQQGIYWLPAQGGVMGEEENRHYFSFSRARFARRCF